MLKKYLLHIAVQDFISVLNKYGSSYFAIFSLKKAKIQYSIDLKKALQEFEDTNNLEDLEDLEESSTVATRSRSNSILTAPPHLDGEDYWGTPRVEFYDTATDANVASIEHDFNDFILQQRIHMHALRKQHGRHKVGRLDGILYAMSRVTLFINWLDLNIKIDNNIAPMSMLDDYYIELMKVLGNYIVTFSFDRALLRFDDFHWIDKSYYLRSGLYDAYFTHGKILKEIDNIGNTLINSLCLLSESFAETDQENKEFALKFIVTTFIQPQISNLKVEAFNNINEKIDSMGLQDGLEASVSPPPSQSPIQEFFDSSHHEDLTELTTSNAMLFNYAPANFSPSVVVSHVEKAVYSSPKRKTMES